MLRGALRKPKRVPAGLAATAPTVVVGGADAAHEVQPLAHRVDVEAGSERGEAFAVDAPRRLEEAGPFAVEDDADVDELLAVDAGHAAEHDVLVGQSRRRSRGTHPGQPRPGREPSRQERDVRRAEVVGRCGTGHRLEPAVGHLRDDLPEVIRGQLEVGVDGRQAIDRRAEDVVADVPGLGGEPGRVGDARGPARGGSTAPLRGRSPTRRRARGGGWGCARCGRRWR